MESDKRSVRDAKDDEIQRLKTELELSKLSQQTGIEDTLNSIRGKDNSGGINQIPYSEKNHPEVYLYKPLGNKMGPFHPRNAEEIVLRWHKAGITLTTTQPTEEQIAEYKRSPKCQELTRQHEELRAKRHKNSRKPEDVAAKMAKDVAIAVATGMKDADSHK